MVASADLNLRDFVTELIDYFEDRAELDKLIRTVAEERPSVDVLQQFKHEFAVDSAETTIDPALIETRFNKMVDDLGSDSLAAQINAAATLLTFLKPEYADYHDRVYYILRAQLKEDHHASVKELLIEAFERAIRLDLPQGTAKSTLDMSRTNLQRIDLRDQDLSGVDIAFANLQNANLENASLFRAKGFGVDLTNANLTKANLGEARLQEGILERSSLNGANLVSADLKRADLCNTTCKQAKLQSAHLEGAKLMGAQFEQANLNDAYFQGAQFDDAALRSITRAYHWQNAHFDAPIMRRLTQLSGS